MSFENYDLNLFENVLNKINSREARVGVIGLGYVGLPLAVEAAASGFKTTGFDVQGSKVEMINSGRNYITDIEEARFIDVVNKGMLSASGDFSLIAQMDFIFICVPTPLDDHQQPKMDYIYESTRVLAQHIKRGAVIVLESTTYPGTTEEYMLPALENGSGLKCGTDFYLGFSPERVDPGNSVYRTGNIPKVVGAVGREASRIICLMYNSILDSKVYEVSSPKAAEMEKLLENTYRNVNIGLINEFAVICEKMNINIWEVIEAAKTKPYGFQAFYPGPGPGGHCIPLDPFYLTWKLKEYNYNFKVVEASGSVNNYMPIYIGERCSRILNRYKKPLNGSKILIIGVAYKKDIADYRESPAIKVIEYLENEGASVTFYDPYITEFTHDNKFYKGIRELTHDDFYNTDLTVITTGHSNLNYEFIQKNSSFVFDAVNSMKDIENRENIELL